jgi:hypothetical protein
MEHGKPRKRAVIGTFYFRGKRTSRKFIGLEVVFQACTAGPLARAWLIGAGALFLVILKLAIH